MCGSAVALWAFRAQNTGTTCAAGAGLALGTTFTLERLDPQLSSGITVCHIVLDWDVLTPPTGGSEWFLDLEDQLFNPIDQIAMKHYILTLLVSASGSLAAQHTHRLSVVNDVFDPEFLVVEAGDPIEVRLTGPHTLTEVSPATFRANGMVSNGGIRIGPGLGYGFNGTDADEITITLQDTGDYYFVSEGASGVAAKAKVIVINSTNTGVGAAVDRSRPLIFPNPANDHVRFAAYEHLDMMTVEAFDQSGRRVLESVLRGNEPLNVLNLPPGHYTLRLSDGMSTIHGVERLVIDREG